MKKNIVRIVCWTAVLLWMALIFAFSAENAAASSESSGGFLRTIFSFLKPGFGKLSDTDQTLLVEANDHFVRKLAHFCIFSVLGALLHLALSRDLPGSRAFLLALFIGAAYAVSDEIHQYFVPGRACMFRDMLLDSAGVLTGDTFLWLLNRLFHFNHHQKT